MSQVHRGSFWGLLMVAFAGGCGDPGAVSLGPAEEVGDSYGLMPMLEAREGGGPRRALRPGACAGAAYRQFDFWVGDWNVVDPSGVSVGTNFVRGELDGCLVTESWTDSTGSRGRSLNVYEAATGTWHQTWVAESLGHVRMGGGLDAEGRMVLAGQRVSATTGATIYDRYVWTRLAPDLVRQEGTLDVPARGVHAEFVGLYQRGTEVVPVPAPGTGNCQAGGRSAASRDFDFALGHWRVQAEHGPRLGESELASDLSGCVFEEDFQGPFGYRTKSFTYYDVTERRWYETLVDNQGGRVELVGALTDGRLVLTGTASTGGGPQVMVRMSLESLAAGAPGEGARGASGGERLRRVWELSADGGTSWRPGLTMIYRRR